MLTGLPRVGDRLADLWIQYAAVIRNDEVRIRDSGRFAFVEDKNRLLIAIETDLQQKTIWLIGMYSSRTNAFTQLFEKDDEEALLTAFIQQVEDLDWPTIIYYGGNRFDENCLKQRLEQYGLDAGLAVLANAHDIGLTVHHGVLGRFRRFKLDYIAEQLGSYEVTDMDGLIVGAQYTRYLRDGDKPDWDTLLDYNKDDVMAVKAVTETIADYLISV